MRTLILLLLVAFVVAFPPIDSCNDTTILPLEADGIQWIKGRDPIISALYREWWFFAAYDPKANIAFCFSYGLFNPAKTLQYHPEASIASMVWPMGIKTKTGSIQSLDKYHIDDFTGFKENATLNIQDQNYIRVIDSKTYQCVGKTKNLHVSWNITYTQHTDACRQRIDVPQLLQLDWISYMPSAKVTGVVRIGDQETKIDTIGYHDHNYGAWPSTLFNWVWAQYAAIDLNFSLVIGGYHIPLLDKYVGYVFIRYKGTHIKIGTLCGDHYSLEPLEFVTINGKKYSVHNIVKAESKEYKINIEYRASVYDLNLASRPLGLIVYEQISEYKVTMYQKTSNGDWKSIVDSSGFGFSEWSHSSL
jgi:hypothetical protein